MRQIVMLVLLISIAINFSGCCCKEPLPAQVVYIPQKCVIPMVEKPAIDNERHESNEDIVTKAILNYVEMKKYAEKLLAAQEVCR